MKQRSPARKMKFRRFHPVAKFGIAVDKNIDNIVKTIAFVISIAIFAISLFGGFVLLTLDPLLKVLGLGIILVGTIIAAITLFLIYSLGHLLTQNKIIIGKLYELNNNEE